MKLESIVLLLKASFIFKGFQEEKFAYCESYNPITCVGSDKENCYTREKCGPITDDRHNHCFTLWEYNPVTNVSEVKMKGCFLNNKDCYETSHCIEKNREGINQLYFCCCNGQMCNRNITYKEILIKKQDVIPASDMEFQIFFMNNKVQVVVPILASLFFFIGIAIFISYLYCRQNKSGEIEISKVGLRQSSVLPTIMSQSSLSRIHLASDASYQSQTHVVDTSLMEIELIEKKASGRFGEIWEAKRRSGETVAIKVFAPCEKKSWQTELNVFQQTGMNHEAILRFIGGCRIGDGLNTEYWLCTEYCDKGSLYEYLKKNTITWKELFHIALSIAKGLSHLHEERFDSLGNSYKPAIAHRDFKSKNVLLTGNNPMRVCIADFNLALTIESGIHSISQCGRVGTLRYMAPEVLDGAISFRKNAILIIDMYACALVFWELMSRCVFGEEPVSDYQIPFQTDVGLTPSLSEMRDCVVHKKLRPQIKDNWKQNSDLAVICSIMEECWDHDPDARISSSTVLDRIISLNKSQ